MFTKSVVPKIVIINVMVFFLWNIYGIVNPEFMIEHFLVSWTALGHGRIWTLLTSVFSHNMLWHILINMFVLYNFGTVIEIYLGSKRFLTFYLLAGIAGSIVHCLVSAFILQSPTIAALGASGAVSGVVIFFALLYPREKIFIFGIIPIPALWAAVIFVGIDILGLIDQTRGGGTPIGHGAHLGGAMTGILYFLMLLRMNKRIRNQ